MKYLLGFAAVLALAACNPRPEPLGPVIQAPTSPALSAAQVRDSLVGKTGTGPISGSRIEYSMYLAPDGTAQAKMPTGIDRGNWRIMDDGQLCLKWALYRGGNEYCQLVYQEGGVHKLYNNKAIEVLAFNPGKTF